MPDDAHLARIEERVEEFRKHIVQRLDQHEDLDDRRFGDLADTIRAEFASFEKLMRTGMDAAVVTLDAKTTVLQAKLEAQVAAAEAKLAVEQAINRPYRIALGILGAVLLTTFAGLVISAILATQGVKLTPQLPPVHSTQERKER